MFFAFSVQEIDVYFLSKNGQEDKENDTIDFMKKKIALFCISCNVKRFLLIFFYYYRIK